MTLSKHDKEVLRAFNNDPLRPKSAKAVSPVIGLVAPVLNRVVRRLARKGLLRAAPKRLDPLEYPTIAEPFDYYLGRNNAVLEYFHVALDQLSKQNRDVTVPLCWWASVYMPNLNVLNQQPNQTPHRPYAPGKALRNTKEIELFRRAVGVMVEAGCVRQARWMALILARGDRSASMVAFPHFSSYLMTLLVTGYGRMHMFPTDPLKVEAWARRVLWGDTTT